LPIRHRNQHLALLQYTGNRFVALTFKRHFEDVTNDLRRFGIDDPLLRIIGRFDICSVLSVVWTALMKSTTS
jgi:hypothetical protein